MKTIGKKLKNAILGTVGTAILAGGAIAQEPIPTKLPEPIAVEKVEAPVIEETPTVTFGFNALEAAMTDDGKLFNRTYTNIDFNFDNFKLTYHGLNQADNLGKDETGTRSFDSYFGTHNFGIAPAGGLTELVLNFKTDSEGIIEGTEGIGLRDYGLVKQIADYGWARAITDGKDLELSTLLGWKLSDKLGMELYHSPSLNFSTGNIGHYTELTPLKLKIGDNTDLFFRIEGFDLNFGNDARYLIGISTTF
ncbi:hypothetical protein HOF78_01190 [Candidatus Woesearchaeota archaeon]|jgi:hypothetical protein|nr:hypothetical protein [Candidatus Woesearchaeota archaeon]MBT6045003.1 hypothetical protein [Candidatus Woesearchaeota archaeon]